MTIRHHLSDQLLMAYAAGQLPEAFNLVVATHVSLCDDCRARAASFDTVGGALLEEAEEIAMGEDALTCALARIEDLQQATRSEPLKSAGIFPAPLADYVGGDLSAVRWRKVGGGVKQAILPTGKDASARLLFIPAGTAVPDHGHRGMELTLVLQGAFADDNDRFGRGDIEIADE
ncbi:MAG: ChrR family anti-sigma-E factor, partial [Paracoccaceae bacterium]